MNKFLIYIFTSLYSGFAFSQDIKPPTFNFIVDVVGQKGVYVAIGVIFFAMTYKNSVKLFSWIEDQTYGTRDYILHQFELLQKDIKPHYVTYGLLFLTFGLGAITFSTFAIFGKFGTGAFIAIFVAFIGWKVPKPIMNSLVNSRIRKFEDQMTDALNLLSNGLRAGLSLPQSIGLVVDELPAPVSEEFNLILQQTKIGVPLEEAFENFVKRVPTQDNDMFVSSVNILRETGGNLAEVFDTISGVIRERVRLKQKIETYVAQGKMQGGIIFCMPWALGLYFGSEDPASMAPLFNTIIGNIILAVAIGLDLLGGFLILKIIKIKI